MNRMKFSGLDPSLALVRKWGFLWFNFFVLSQAFACKTENEFDDLIAKLKQVNKLIFNWNI
jgi:hypothetical protein